MRFLPVTGILSRLTGDVDTTTGLLQMANRKEVWPGIRMSRRSLNWIFRVAESRCQPAVPSKRPPLCPEDHGAL